MKKVLVFGTFDGIHPGHMSFLKQARSLGDYLVASVARDSFVKEKKERTPLNSESERRRLLLDTGLVNEAYLGDEDTGSYSIVRTVKPDIVCFGYDQMELMEDLSRWLDERRDEFPRTTTVVLHAYRPEKYKSSKLNFSDVKRP